MCVRDVERRGVREFVREAVQGIEHARVVAVAVVVVARESLRWYVLSARARFPPSYTIMKTCVSVALRLRYAALDVMFCVCV